MEKVLIIVLCLVGLSMLMMPGSAFGEPLQDPGIPNGEVITYVSRVEDDSTTIVEEVALRREGENYLYEITSSSKLLDRKIVLLKESMGPLTIHTARKFQDVTLDSTLKVIDEKPNPAEGEMKLADFSILTYVLRGFPFGKINALKIGYFGEQRKNSYSMSVKCKGKEKVKVRCGTIECYKLEFGVDGFFGTFLPKMNAWYSVASPHYLVYYEGPDGPPGTPKRVMEMVQYYKPPL